MHNPSRITIAPSEPRPVLLAGVLAMPARRSDAKARVSRRAASRSSRTRAPAAAAIVFLRDLAKHLGPIMKRALRRREHHRRQRREGDGLRRPRQAGRQRLLRDHADVHPDVAPVEAGIRLHVARARRHRVPGPGGDLHARGRAVEIAGGIARLRAPQSRQVALGRRQPRIARTDRAGAPGEEGRRQGAGRAARGRRRHDDQRAQRHARHRRRRSAGNAGPAAGRQDPASRHAVRAAP